MDITQIFDVIVVGGGHAGTEAALAAARMNMRTLLISPSLANFGQMSCNPAIGGTGKGQLVKEIDALGGIMAVAADHAGIQFRILNARKGPAVRGTRAQADRVLYQQFVRHAIENQPNLYVFQDMVADLSVINDHITGIVTQGGLEIKSKTVVLTAGTFLGGRIHVGLNSYQGGRAGDPPSLALAQRLRDLPFRVDRLKTGTPPRIDRRSIDFSQMQEQPGDEPTPLFSFLGKLEHHPRQVSCYITHTNLKTHDIIQKNFDRSPMYTGIIEGVGPRYCPSIEDKVVRFAEKTGHQIFVEPEGLTSNEIYPNGISTSLPFDVQVDFVRSILGFEQAHITRPGYAIEYDFFDPRDLHPWLETKPIQGLFFAGQINGTTGYEEAAAQGLIAGLNAARRAQDLSPWYPRRDQAYIGVLIDDLITSGTQEPYRMFTSRAEYRLTLREDNADLRLTEIGRELCLVNDERWQALCEKREAIERAQQHLQRTVIHPHKPCGAAYERIFGHALEREFHAYDLLRRPEITHAELNKIESVALELAPSVAEQVEIQAKYEGYIQRQQLDIERCQRYEDTKIPTTLDYVKVIGLSTEVRQKLQNVKPHTIAQAARIPGVTPAAISLLLIHLKRGAH